MMAVGLGAEQARGYIEAHSDVSIACYNSPKSVTLSGSKTGIDVIEAILTKAGVFCRKLNTAGNAYHSFMMKPVGEDYQKLLEVSLPATQEDLPQSDVTMYSSVSNEPITRTTVSRDYWRQNLESPVMSSQAAHTLLTSNTSINHIVEIGPHAALSGPIRDISTASGLDATRLDYSATLKRGENGVDNLLQLAGDLFLVGYSIDLSEVNKASGRDDTPSLLVDLPPYQWNYEDLHWAESRLSSDFRFRKHARHDLLGSREPSSSGAAPSWRNILSLKNVPWLRDHKVGASFILIDPKLMRKDWEPSCLSCSRLRCPGNRSDCSSLDAAAGRSITLQTAECQDQHCHGSHR
jgi:acyl transferase domain-containing protein